jgi:inner membrane protein involved in colicin E2 resistance
MEKYNKMYLALWLLFSAITLAFLSVFVLSSLGGILEVDENLEGEGLVLSFFLLFFISEIVGFILARSTIDRASWAYYLHTFTTSFNRRTNLGGSQAGF